MCKPSADIKSHFFRRIAARGACAEVIMQKQGEIGVYGNPTTIACIKIVAVVTNKSQGERHSQERYER